MYTCFFSYVPTYSFHFLYVPTCTFLRIGPYVQRGTYLRTRCYVSARTLDGLRARSYDWYVPTGTFLRIGPYVQRGTYLRTRFYVSARTLDGLRARFYDRYVPTGTFLRAGPHFGRLRARSYGRYVLTYTIFRAYGHMFVLLRTYGQVFSTFIEVCWDFISVSMIHVHVFTYPYAQLHTPARTYGCSISVFLLQTSFIGFLIIYFS